MQSFNRKIRNWLRLKTTLSNSIFMKSLPTTIDTQSIIIEKIKNNSMLVIRFGLYEYLLCYQYLEKCVGIRSKYSEYVKFHIKNDAGIVWKSEEDIDSYAKNIIDNLRYVDVIAYWRNYPSKFIFAKYFNKDVKHINVEDLYPFPFWHKESFPNWHHMLEGKKVLVVTSFEETVTKQYRKRKMIWDNCDEILPPFQLITYQAVCTNGGNNDERFLTWEDAVSFMVKEILNLEFDIALVSCGGYGMPLAMELKKRDKLVIQWGGCYQLWFGIMGTRWEHDGEVTRYLNDYWVYPSEKETPPLAESVNSSCYWKKRDNDS